MWLHFCHSWGWSWNVNEFTFISACETIPNPTEFRCRHSRVRLCFIYMSASAKCLIYTVSGNLIVISSVPTWCFEIRVARVWFVQFVLSLRVVLFLLNWLNDVKMSTKQLSPGSERSKSWETNTSERAHSEIIIFSLTLRSLGRPSVVQSSNKNVVATRAKFNIAQVNLPYPWFSMIDTQGFG